MSLYFVCFLWHCWKHILHRKIKCLELIASHSSKTTTTTDVNFMTKPKRSSLPEKTSFWVFPLLVWCYCLIMENTAISILCPMWTHSCAPIESYHRYTLEKGKFTKVILAFLFLKFIPAQKFIKPAQVFWSMTWPHNRAEPMPVQVMVMRDVHRKLFCPSNSVYLLYLSVVKCNRWELHSIFILQKDLSL